MRSVPGAVATGSQPHSRAGKLNRPQRSQEGGLPPLMFDYLEGFKSGGKPLPNCEITIVEFIMLCSF